MTGDSECASADVSNLLLAVSCTDSDLKSLIPVELEQKYDNKSTYLVVVLYRL